MTMYLPTNQNIQYVTPVLPQAVSQTQTPQVVFIQNDQSTLKGIFWGIAAFKLGAETLTLGATTMGTMPFIITPLAPIPLIAGFFTCLFANATDACIKNASYHLGSSHKIVVLQNA